MYKFFKKCIYDTVGELGIFGDSDNLLEYLAKYFLFLIIIPFFFPCYLMLKSAELINRKRGYDTDLDLSFLICGPIVVFIIGFIISLGIFIMHGNGLTFLTCWYLLFMVFYPFIISLSKIYVGNDGRKEDDKQFEEGFED